MIFKLSRYLFFIGLFAFLSMPVFAEGDVVCSGRVMGSTNNFNANFGKLYFDTHGAPDDGVPVGYGLNYGQEVDVSIIGGTTGLAPGNRRDAACVNEGTGNFSHDGVTLNGYEYQIEKYAWSDNVGFIDFLGAETFGVKIGPDVAGTRELAGYAWSGSSAGPAFGFIQFKGLRADLVPYGVTMNSATGMLFGYAWSEAGIWVDFTGVQVELPGETLIVPGGDICSGIDYLCVNVSIHEGINDYWYDLEVSLMDSDGVTPLNIDTPATLPYYEFSATFEWEDSIKLNQLAHSTGTFDDNPTPINDGGGLLSKPISIADNAEFLALFEEVPADSGNYQLKKKLKSLAPTSASNVSLTTSTLPPLAIKNEFFADELSYGGAVWTSEIEPNELILKRVDYSISTGGVPVAGEPVFPGNLTSGYRFEFAPVIDVGVLYAGDHEDTIIGFRNVPISFTMKESHSSYLDYSNAEVFMMVDYNRTLTTSECDADSNANFDYYFTDSGLSEIDVIHNGNGDWTFDQTSTPSVNPAAIGFQLNELSSEQVYNAVAAIPSYDPDDPLAQLPCDVVQGPTFYTVVKYDVNPGEEANLESDPVASVYDFSEISVYLGAELIGLVERKSNFDFSFDPDFGINPLIKSTLIPKTIISPVSDETVYYYSNKIPRILSAAYNPAAIIHGNVYAAKALSPTASHETQETGYMSVNIVRNTINENISKFLGEIDVNEGDACTVMALDSFGGVETTCESGTYETFDVGDEHVLVLDGTDLTLAFDVDGDGDSILEGDWVVIVQDAKVFIDKDIYHGDTSVGSLVLISISTYDGSCDNDNIYLHADVKNIDANIVADCSLFPYSSELDNFNQPIAMPDAVTGIPDWTYEEKVKYLNKQKLFRGSLFARNTIGGADLDSLAGEKYLLDGTGVAWELPVDLDVRLNLQNYDLNYMAFFMLSVEMANNGWPIDQRCQKALTIEDMVAINNDPSGHNITGEAAGSPLCDGIDLVQFDPNTLDGDLIVLEENEGNLARGLEPFSYNPVYIYAVSSDSFVFKTAGGVTSN